MNPRHHAARRDVLRVLVADDELEVARLITAALKEIDVGNVKVVWAKDGVEALATFQRNARHLDCVICDMKMPKKSGLDVLRGVREIDADMPFLMVTAFATQEAVVTAKKLGVSGFVAKPFTIDDLVKKVSAATSRPFPTGQRRH